ncbi:hypothetical protein [Coraliomargarita parva]|uniref:hypothetical protein n=1 Tax=Coraliomargarita parva TaxID=3014050 RepID=UPI0022B5A989|nr:hypothetical protein [Coraliomargarita parva]
MALLLMAFVVFLMLSLSLIIKVDTQAAETNAQAEKAKANALLGLQVAIGQLQRLAGPDTRVTARADIYGVTENSPYRFWTGVWDSQDDNPGTAGSNHALRKAYLAHNADAKPVPLAWLTSGLDNTAPEDLNPLSINIPSNQQVLLVSADSTTNVPAVFAGKQTINTRASEPNGSYAWWVGDEGVKARINTDAPLRNGNATIDDLLGPTFDTGTDQEKETLLSSALGSTVGVHHTGSFWDNLPDTSLKDLSKAASYEDTQIPLNLSSDAEYSEFNVIRHDFTTYSRSLLTDIRKGGFKKDLTLAFQEPEVFEQFFGVQPSTPTYAYPSQEKDALTEGLKNFSNPPQELFLTPEIQSVNSESNVGPNWGTLYHYYHLYEIPGVADGAIKPIFPWPQEEGKAVRNPPMINSDTYPYTNYWDPDLSTINSTRQDRQHLNNPITPIIERFQMTFRIGAITETVDGETKYKLRFYMQPMLGLWNPYNIKIKRAYDDNDYPDYKLEYEAAPELEISGVYDGGPHDGEPFTKTINLAAGGTKAKDKMSYTDGFWTLYLPTDFDLLPGEIRLLSSPNETAAREKELAYGWQENNLFYFSWPSTFLDDPESDGTYDSKDLDDPNHPNNIYVDGDATITIRNLTFKDRIEPRSGKLHPEHHHGAFFELKHRTPSNNSGLSAQSFSGLWKDTEYAANNPSWSLYPGTAEDGVIPAFTPSSIANSSIDLGTWTFYLRTTLESNKALRNLIDANPRAINGTPRYDGPDLFATAAFQAGGDNGYLPPGSVIEPSFGDYDRYTGLNGSSISDPSLGVSRLVLFDVPRYPPVSIGQFQHANLARYGFEPTYLLGNSYANPRIPLDSTQALDFDAIIGMNLFDTAYMVNDQIFDEYFLSTVDSGINEANFQSLISQSKRPYNTRLSMVVPEGATLDQIRAFDDPTTIQAWGGRFMVDGAFNINSTSVYAWKAMLSSMDQPFLRVDIDETAVDAGSLTETDPDGVYISHLSLPIFDQGYEENSTNNEAFFQGYRKLSDAELTDLANAIVQEVKDRGPFLSMADFINRRPNSDTTEYQRRGALQAALDQTINQNISDELAAPAVNLDASIYSQAVDNSGSDSQATGYPGYVLQGDILQALAPLMTARSDTFVIRAYGSSDNITGSSNEAWCEAVVQRVPDMVGTGNDLSNYSMVELAAETASLSNTVNQKFGRSFRIVAFRWLSKDEL